jgi:Acetyltransferase (GNAT) domain
MSELMTTRLGFAADAAERPDLSSPSWELLDGQNLRDPGLCRELRDLMERSGDVCLLHDPLWLGAGDDGALEHPARGANAFYVSRGKDGLIGYAPFTCGSRLLRFAIGELIVYRRRLRSSTLVHDVIADAGPETRRALTGELLDILARRLRPDEGIFLDGVPIDSPLFELVSSSAAQRGLLTVRLSDAFEHQLTKLPPTFRDYEAQLGSHSRLNLRHRRKKLLTHVAGELRTARFTDGNSVAAFVADAQKVSQTTYQWRLLGLGLRDAVELRATLAFAARHGWLRSYILYCRGEPVAFMLGYLYRRTYHYMDVGYDPAWAQWGVGSILQMEVMKDLIEDPERPEIFDFSTGYGDHKARFGNFSRSEVNLLLLRKCSRNAILVAAYAATLGVDKHASRWLDTLGLKTAIKRWVRQKA